MKNLGLALVFMLASPVDAASACHRYARWYYPFPQRCGDGHHAARARRDDSHDWYVEFVFPQTLRYDAPPDNLTVEERAARDILRAAQGGSHGHD